MQERLTLQKSMKALKDYTEECVLKTRKNKAASMEYTWWLGKRAFSHLRSHYNQKRSNHAISSMVVGEWSLGQKRKIFQAVKLYASFYGQR